MTKPRPSRALVKWIDSIDEDLTFLSVLTIGELRSGWESLGRKLVREREEFNGLKEQFVDVEEGPPNESFGETQAREQRAFQTACAAHPELAKATKVYSELLTRNSRLAEWYPDLIIRFEGRILDVDRRVCEAWGCTRARLGRPLPAVDSLIAATADVHELMVVTRNDSDFKDLTALVMNPWEERASVDAP